MTVIDNAVEMAPRLDWREFRDETFDWRQGEHLTIIGPTGTGKTTLLSDLLLDRSYVIFLGSKRKDETQDEFLAQGYREVTDPHKINADLSAHWLLRPVFNLKDNARESIDRMRAPLKEALNMIYRQGDWTVVVDEARQVTDFLGLDKELILLWNQGRSQGNTIVAGVQRPRHVPLEAYDQASHLFFFKDPDEANIARVAEIAGVSKKIVAATVKALKPYEFLYVSPRTGEMYVSKMEV